MYREIKFRAWDKSINAMLGNIVVYQGEAYLNTNPLEQFPLDAELMQFTGLLDKNGKEIYEGDIVGYEHIRAKIIFGYCGFEFEWIDGKTGKIRQKKTEEIFRNISIIFEVIGNIYENPEFLEVNQC